MSEEKQVIVTRQQSSPITPWANRAEVRELAGRLQALMPGGSKLNEAEALMLAQAALIHGLDPLNGELWLLKGKDGKFLGLMAGIKGHRRAAHNQIQREGGGNYWPEFEGPLSIDEMKALDIPTDALAFRCKVRDTQTITAYVSEIERLMKAGLPWEIVSDIVGARPYTVGVGYAVPSESSRMSKVQLAMKRAEADALKRRFDLPFGNAVGTSGDSDILDGEFTIVEEAAVISPEAMKQAAAETLAHNGAILHGDDDEHDAVETRIKELRRASNGKPSAALRERYTTLLEKALALNIIQPALAADCTADQMTEAGLALKAAIELKEAAIPKEKGMEI